jgi:hypothetical protein
VFFGLRAEAQFINVFNDLTQIIAARDFVFDLSEDFADLVFDSVRPAGLLIEAVQIRE